MVRKPAARSAMLSHAMIATATGFALVCDVVTPLPC
jgi:hypothetical protein